MPFFQRVVIVVLVIGLALALWQLRSLLIVIFAAILLAVALRACTNELSRATGLGRSAALFVVIFLGIVTAGLLTWLFGSIVSEQFDVLAQTLPKSASALIEAGRTQAFGRYILEHVQDVDVPNAAGKIASLVATAAGFMISGLLYGVLILTVGIYFAAQPILYRDGVISLFPPSARKSALDLSEALRHVLLRWLIGQFIVMLIVGGTSGLILWAVGIDAALALGLISGLLTFIPYVGAILGAVPATLVALSKGPAYAGFVLLMYLGIHYLEGDFVTPWVQARATALPAALSVLSTVIFAVLFGPAGVFVAAPLTLVLMVFVNTLNYRRVSAPPGVE